MRALKEGKTSTVSGTEVPVKADSVCIHSDTPGAAELARAVHEAVAASGGEVGLRDNQQGAPRARHS